MDNKFESHIMGVKKYLKKFTLIAIVASIMCIMIFILSYEQIISEFNWLIFALLLLLMVVTIISSAKYFLQYNRDLNWILTNYYTEKQMCINLIKKRITGILKRNNYNEFKEICKHSKSNHMINLYHLMSAYDILNDEEF